MDKLPKSDKLIELDDPLEMDKSQKFDIRPKILGLDTLVQDA